MFDKDSQIRDFDMVSFSPKWQSNDGDAMLLYSFYRLEPQLH
jgi:hypothetical protein